MEVAMLVERDATLAEEEEHLDRVRVRVRLRVRVGLEGWSSNARRPSSRFERLTN